MATIIVSNEREARALWRACMHERRCRVSANEEYWYKDENFAESEASLKYLRDIMTAMENEFGVFKKANNEV